MFQSLYGKNANVFAAIPSLHAAYMLVTTIYAVISRQRKAVIALFAIICMGIWWTAVYTSHHYLIDVALGIATCVVAVVVFECLLLKVPFIRNTFNGYIRRIS